MKAGERVVLMGQAHGTIEAVRPDGFEVRIETGDRTTVHPDDAAKLLRPMLDKAGAERLIDAVAEPIVERTAPKLRGLRKFRRAPLELQTAYLQLHYRLPDSLSAHEEEMLVTASELLFKELSQALDVDVATVKRRHAEQPDARAVHAHAPELHRRRRRRERDEDPYGSHGFEMGTGGDGTYTLLGDSDAGPHVVLATWTA